MLKPLIIFDCDGVLVETEAITNRHMAEIFTSLGFAIDGDACRRRFQGKAMRDVCAEVSGIVGKNIDPQWVRGEIYQHLTSGVPAVEGVEDLVERLLTKNYSVCVASSGSIEKMHITLGQTRLLPMLRHVLFSADAVARGKPHPDIFEHAAANMGRTPSEAIIIEDSVTGVEAGRAAGAHVLGYCGDPFTDTNRMRDAGAEVFNRMSEAVSLIENR